MSTAASQRERAPVDVKNLDIYGDAPLKWQRVLDAKCFFVEACGAAGAGVVEDADGADGQGRAEVAEDVRCAETAAAHRGKQVVPGDAGTRLE